MDFSAATLWEGKDAPPNFVNKIDEDDLLVTALDAMDPTKRFPQNALEHDYTLLGRDLVDEYKKFCPSGHSPQLAFTSVGIAPWLPPTNPAVTALYAADAAATVLKRGAFTVEWAPIHALSPSFLDNNNQPQAAYYGVRLIHQVAIPGDIFVGATSQSDTVAVHAVKSAMAHLACF